MTIYGRSFLTTISALAFMSGLTAVAFAQAGPGGPDAGGPPPPPDAGGPPPPPTDGGPPPNIFAQGASGLTLEQVTLKSGAPSQGRGAPPPAADAMVVGPNGANFGAANGDAPAGITPLARDIFTSDDFYVDRDLWTDPRYYRCSSPAALENYWDTNLQLGNGQTGPAVGGNFPATAAWGKCDADYPREEILSPYSYSTAQEHYEALLAEVNARGGPTRHTKETLPDWNGRYTRVGFRGDAPMFDVIGLPWYRGSTIQAPTYLSILTPEYQERMVQQMYHTANTNAPEWPGSYCWPEGFMRRFFDPDKYVMLVPEMVQIWNHLTETLMTQVAVDRQFNMDGTVPNLHGDLRQWFGDTVGFWDGDVLITWTSNVEGWTAHGWFEWSDQMQSVEIYTPLVAGDDGRFVGINHESVFYDPEALVAPVRIVENWEWAQRLNEGETYDWRVCVQTLFPIEGKTMPVNPGDTIEYTVPDMSDRPWARIWEQYFEDGMQRPEEDDVLAGFN